uniref:MIP07009p n=1 Tax=Drosophila melanogaster TaxID=7227 RepID=C0PV04_DROME|nr:MIP07009p [Drosophila melanogaster]
MTSNMRENIEDLTHIFRWWFSSVSFHPFHDFCFCPPKSD